MTTPPYPLILLAWNLFIESSKTTSLSVTGHEVAMNNANYERLESLVNGQAEVLEMISRGDSLHSILEAIINWVEKHSDGLYASILFVDAEEKHLLHGVAPGLDAEYNKAIHGIPIGPQVGSCGTAVYRKEAVIVEDIATDPLWSDYKDLAIRFGLRACWSTPLIGKNGKAIGAFAIYYKQPHKPTPDDLQLIKLVSHTTEIAIEYKFAEQQRTELLLNEKKLYETAEEERQHFYKLLMDAPALIAVLKGPDHVYELINPLYTQVIAGKRDILGKPIREALPELEGQGIYELLDRVYKSNEPNIDSELPLKIDRSNTGVLEDVYFNFIFQPLKTEADAMEGILILAVDVTEQVNARKRAEQSEERFRSFVLNSPSPIAIYVGREMLIQTANDAILQSWGKDASVIGKTFKEALPELEGQPFSQLLDTVYTTGIPYQANEARVDLFRNGRMEITYFNFNYKALRDEKGNIYGVINTGTEVTDLAIAKQQLIIAEEGLRNAIDLAELGTWSMSIPNDTLTYSDRVKEWFGLTENRTSLKNFLDSIHEEDRQRVVKAVEQALRFKSDYEIEYRVIQADTRYERIIHAKGKVVSTIPGAPLQLQGTVRDVTLQKMTQFELEKQVEARTAELKKANADMLNVNESLKQFAYVASHDLQEPLRKINLFTNLLQGQNVNLDAVSKNYLDKISQSAQRISLLIQDVLDFTRMNSGGMIFIPTDLNMIIHAITVDFELIIQQKEALISFGKLCVIEAIPMQMNQLFYNLLSNALKFSKPNTRPAIHITSRLLQKQEVLPYTNLDSDVEYCEIIVKDNGIGFDQDFAEQIFTIFHRLHHKSEYEGTGIGLALCKKIVDTHYGEIFARSQVGQGASFHIILPVKRSSTLYEYIL